MLGLSPGQAEGPVASAAYEKAPDSAASAFGMQQGHVAARNSALPASNNPRRLNSGSAEQCSSVLTTENRGMNPNHRSVCFTGTDAPHPTQQKLKHTCRVAVFYNPGRCEQGISVQSCGRL